MCWKYPVIVWALFGVLLMSFLVYVTWTDITWFGRYPSVGGWVWRSVLMLFLLGYTVLCLVIFLNKC